MSVACTKISCFDREIKTEEIRESERRERMEMYNNY